MKQDDTLPSIRLYFDGGSLTIVQYYMQIWDASRCKRVRTMDGHRLRVGALAWSSSLVSSGSRDKSILQRDIRAQDDFVTKLSGHKSEVRLPICKALLNRTHWLALWNHFYVFICSSHLLNTNWFSCRFVD